MRYITPRKKLSLYIQGELKVSLSSIYFATNEDYGFEIEDDKRERE